MPKTGADPYAKPRRTLDGDEPLREADAKLERIYQIAEDLADGKHARGAARRAGRRIMNLIDGVDEALGLDGQ